MKMADIIAVESVAIATDVNSKKRALEELSILLAKQCDGVGDREIFTALVNREKLGSTGLGSGVGIPHGRVEGVSQPVGAIIRLPSAIDFESVDRQGVDLLFGLAVPKDGAGNYLQVLASIAEICQDSEAVSQMRNCGDAAALHAIIAERLVGSAA